MKKDTKEKKVTEFPNYLYNRVPAPVVDYISCAKCNHFMVKQQEEGVEHCIGVCRVKSVLWKAEVSSTRKACEAFEPKKLN